MVKLHQTGVESVRKGREAIGSELLMTVDVNCEWTPLHATEMALAMNEYDLHWLEEPVWPPEDYPGLAQVMDESGVALAAGENACTVHQFQLMMSEGAVRYAQPSVIKVGGVSEFMKVATLAETYNLSLAPHSPYFGPGFLATLHLIAHTRRAEWVERIYCELEASVFTKPLEFPRRTIHHSRGPGFGVGRGSDCFEGVRVEGVCGVARFSHHVARRSA